MEIKEIQEILKNSLSEHRYNHTIGVYYTAMCLAMRYDYDIKRAGLAAMLHDCAKQFGDDKLIAVCLENDIEISEEEYANPDVLHQKAGAAYAAKAFGIDDKEILDAIGCHTTGRCNMTLLDKIIFTADFIEPGRKELKCYKEIRPLAFIDIDKAVVRILEETLIYLDSIGVKADSQSKVTLDFIKSQEKESAG